MGRDHLPKRLQITPERRYFIPKNGKKYHFCFDYSVFYINIQVEFDPEEEAFPLRESNQRDF